MDQPQSCQCSRPDLQGTGDSRFCLSCGLADRSDTRTSRKRKADEAEIDPGDNKRTAPPPSTRVPFGYKQLRHASEFRLLRLFPGESQDQIEGEVFHADVFHPPAYEAVSYTWGQLELTQELHTRAGLIKITGNCLSALAGLRHDTFERILWIDAICIAQADDLEKNHQIPLMTKIYARATKVLIYLGDQESSSTESLFKRLRRDEVQLPGGTLTAFLSLPWFSRIWVLQEVAMARHAVVILGSATLEWRYLSIGNIHMVGLEPTNVAGQVPPVLQMSGGHKKPLNDLPSLIAMARSCLSSDPRDRIYALLGLVDERAGIDLSPDYTKTTKEVYTDVAIRFFKTYNCLKFLSDIERYDPSLVDGLAPTFSLSGLFDYEPNNFQLQAVNSELEHTILVFREAILRVTRASNFTALMTFSFRKTREMLVERWSVLHSITEKLVMEFRNNRVYSMPTSLQNVLYSLQDLPEQAQKLFPVTSMGKQWLHNALEFCESWKSKLGMLDAALLAFEKSRWEKKAELGCRRFRDPDGLSTSELIEREPPKAINESLDLPTWVPDYRHHLRLSSLAHWQPNTFADEFIARLHQSSGDHISPLLEVKAIIIDKAEGGCGTLMQKVPLCGTETPLTTYIGAEETGFRDRFTQSFMTIEHGADLSVILHFSQGRRLAFTDLSLAIVPAGFDLGDVIAMFYGGTVPYLLRPSLSEPDRFQFIGECYLHGVRGPQFAPNYAELLGWFKDCVMDQGGQDGLPWRTIFLE